MCGALRTGRTLRIPTKGKRRPKRVVRIASVRLRRAGRVLLVRRETGLLAGTWMLPSAVTVDGKSPMAAASSAARDLGIAPARMTPVGAIRHLFTHRDVTAEVFDATVRSTRAKVARGRGDVSRSDTPAPDLLWADERRLDGVAVSSFLRKQLMLKRDKSSEPP
jgi:adenine-specific DNA glycosylase